MSRLPRKRLVPLPLVAWPLLVVLSGCGGPAAVPAAGRVEFSDGEAVRSGRIEFRSRDGHARGLCEIADDGRFSIDGDSGTPGVPAGEYEVIVVQMIITEDLSREAHDHGRRVPRRYADYYTSGLEATVPDGGTDELLVVIEPE